MLTSFGKRCVVGASGKHRACTLMPTKPNGNARVAVARPIFAVSAGEAQSTSGLKTLKDAMTKSEEHSDVDDGNKMWCYQCEQTLNTTGCTSVGVCGKSPEVAGLQDLLVYEAKGLCCLSHHARQQGVNLQEVNTFVNSAMFSTLTNVNFDDERMADFIRSCDGLKDKLKAALVAAGKPMPSPALAQPCSKLWGELPHPLNWSVREATGKDTPTVVDMMEFSHKATITVRIKSLGDTLCGLQELLCYGMKGLCAYAHHAEALGFTDESVYADTQRLLAFLCSPECLEVDAVLAGCMGVGETNLKVLALLDRAHTTSFGHPTPGQVSLKPVVGKAILITGHDMHDLELLLKQTEGTGINVYTHGEMLPGHSYPGLLKYPHLVGHFGGAWYRQKSEFATFPGAILVTTNCVLEPMSSYRNNIFTTNETGVSGVRHIAEKDFSEVIQRAQDLPGFVQSDVANLPAKTLTVGFGHNTVLGAAGDVIKAIEEGRLEHIFLIGGCDGNEPQRKYYSQLFHYMPQETLILTLGCGKFRLFDQDFGNIPGTELPRLMDMGQCNDAYSAVVVAMELAKAFKTDINSLPLSLDLSWFEQKAVAVLLTLLHLGVRNIRLGPRLPAFLTADAVAVMVDKFGLIPADQAHPEEEVKAMIAKH